MMDDKEALGRMDELNRLAKWTQKIEDEIVKRLVRRYVIERQVHLANQAQLDYERLKRSRTPGGTRPICRDG